MRLTSFALDNSLVVVGHRAGELAILNSTARLIWEGKQQGWEVERIVAHLAVVYAISEQVAGVDVAACLASCAQAGLLNDSSPDDPAGREGATGAVADLPDSGEPERLADFAVRRTQNYLLGDRVFCVRYGSDSLWEAAGPLLAHLTIGSEASARYSIDLAAVEGGFRVWRNGHGIARNASRDGALFALHREILAVGCDREWLVALHAAAISDGKQSIVLAGPGGTGKSTLTAALLKSGLVYLSDDVVPLERESRTAVPVPVSLNLKPGSLPVLERYYPGIEALPGYSAGGVTVHFLPPPGFAANPPRGNYPVKHVVFPKYEAGARTEIRAIGGVEALRRLIDGESLLRRPWSAEAVGELVSWIASVRAYTLIYENLEEAAACVRDLLES